MFYTNFISYCTLYHGSCLWHLQNTKTGQFYVTWSRSLTHMNILKLPSRSHCKLLFIVANLIPVYMNSSTFTSETLNSTSIINRLSMSIAINGIKSSVSKSLPHLGAYVNETCICIQIM